MKKYTKPMIVFESFTLSTNIAACGNQVSFEDEIVGGCKAYEYESDFGLMVLFLDANVGCKDTAPSENDTICYHIAADAFSNLLGS